MEISNEMNFLEAQNNKKKCDKIVWSLDWAKNLWEKSLESSKIIEKFPHLGLSRLPPSSACIAITKWNKPPTLSLCCSKNSLATANSYRLGTLSALKMRLKTLRIQQFMFDVFCVSRLWITYFQKSSNPCRSTRLVFRGRGYPCPPPPQEEGEKYKGESPLPQGEMRKKKWNFS